MFLLYKIENDYFLVDGNKQETSLFPWEKDSYVLQVLATTRKYDNVTLPELKIENIDNLIIGDEENKKWGVDVDENLKIYLKNQYL